MLCFRKLTILKLVVVLFLLLLFVMAGCTSDAPGVADKPEVTVEDFFRDNKVTLIVNTNPGGTTDTRARLLAAHWREVVGNELIVENEGGGRGLTALNQVYRAKNDGLTIGSAPLGAHIFGYSVFEMEGAIYDPLEFGYIMNYETEIYPLAVGSNSPYNSVEDLQEAEEIVFGAASPTGGFAMGAAFFGELFELKNFRIVTGMRMGELGVAASRGEIDAFTTAGAGQINMLQQGFIKSPLITLSLNRDPYFPDVKAVSEVKDLTPFENDMLQFLEAVTHGLSYFAPPGVSQDKLEFLRTTFMEIYESEAFKKDLIEREGLWEPAWTGEETHERLQEALELPKETVDTFKGFMGKYMF